MTSRTTAGLGWVVSCCLFLACKGPNASAYGPAPVASPVSSDSANAVRAAVRMLVLTLGDTTLQFRVAAFKRDHAGRLVTLVPYDRAVRGGGGLVLVKDDGTAIVIELYQ